MLPITIYFKYKDTNSLNECLCFPIPETMTYSIFISGQLHDHNGVHKCASGSWSCPSRPPPQQIKGMLQAI